MIRIYNARAVSDINLWPICARPRPFEVAAFTGDRTIKTRVVGHLRLQELPLDRCVIKCATSSVPKKFALTSWFRINPDMPIPTSERKISHAKYWLSRLCVVLSALGSRVVARLTANGVASTAHRKTSPTTPPATAWVMNVLCRCEYRPVNSGGK